MPFAAPIIAGRQAHHSVAHQSLALLLQFLANQCLAHCVTKQCQAKAPRNSARRFISLPSHLIVIPHLALAVWLSVVRHPAARRTHRRRPDQGCAVSVLSKSRLFCAPALPTRSMLCPGFTLHIRTLRNSGNASRNSALPLQTHSHHGHCTATPIHTLRLPVKALHCHGLLWLFHSVCRPGNVPLVSVTHCPG